MNYRGSITDCSVFVTVSGVALGPGQSVHGTLALAAKNSNVVLITYITLYFATCTEMIMALYVISVKSNSQ
jgi:hypothetical protein